jgi:hypothetical protein
VPPDPWYITKNRGRYHPLGAATTVTTAMTETTAPRQPHQTTPSQQQHHPVAHDHSSSPVPSDPWNDTTNRGCHFPPVAAMTATTTATADRQPHSTTPSQHHNHSASTDYFTFLPLRDPWTTPIKFLENPHPLRAAPTITTTKTAITEWHPNMPTPTHQQHNTTAADHSHSLSLPDLVATPTNLPDNIHQLVATQRTTPTTDQQTLAATPTHQQHHTEASDQFISIPPPDPRITPRPSDKSDDNNHEYSDSPTSILTPSVPPFSGDHGGALCDPPFNRHADNGTADQTPVIPCYSEVNTPYGDFTHPRKPPHIMRFYSVNIHGLGLSSGTTRTQTIAQQTAGTAIDVLGLIATDTNWSLRHQMQFNSSFRPFSQNIHTQFSSIPTTLPSAYQPGGNLILTLNSINSYATIRESDPMGRWAATTFEPSSDISFTYIVAYCPTRECGRSTIYTSWRQQVLHLEQAGIDNPDPIKIFFHDLKSFIRTKQDNHHDILLAIDANSHNDDLINHMDTLMDQTQLIDAILARHPSSQTQPLPNTFIRGTKRIDFLCCSKALVSAIYRVGYDAFGEIFDTDHRGMTLDLDWRKLCGTNVPTDIHRIKSLSTRRKDHIETYKATLLAYFTSHNFHNRIIKLQNMMKSGTSTPEITTMIDKLDQDYTRGMLTASKACKGSYATPFSSRVVNLRKVVGYWNLRLRSHRSVTDLSKQLSDLADRIEWTDFLPPPILTLADIKAHRKMAIQELHQYLRKAENEYRHNLFAAYQHTNANEALSWSQVSQFEHQSRIKATYARLKHARSKQTSGGVSSVSTPIGDSWRRLTDPNEIASAIFERNTRHFSQAEGTPFTDPLVSTLIRDMVNDPIESVYQTVRSFLPASARQLVKDCTTSQLPTIDPYLSVHEIKQYFRRWKETTSTSPSGRTLVHYKLMLIRDTEESSSLSAMFWEGIKTILNACTRFGHSLPRWHTVHNTMIFKKPGDDRIDKMRVIHIFEADYNMLLGITFKKVNDSAERHSSLGDLQWGSRSGRTCEDVLALKLWSHEISKFSRTTLSTFENDAKSCYDRIVMDFALLRSRQLGLPPSFVQMYTQSLQQSRFYFASKGHIDDRFYSPATNHAVHGPGQGSTAATYSWTNVSTCAMSILDSHHDGATFCSPDSETSHRRSIEGIVDDTSISGNQFIQELNYNRDHGWNHIQNKNIASQCITNLAATAQHWEQLLWSTGGALELSKCWYYLSHWNFDSVGNPYILSLDQMSHYPCPPICITNSAGGTYKISQLPPESAQRTLGFMSCPDGQQKSQFLMLQMKARDLARAISATYTTESDARKYYFTVARPSLTYANRISHLSQKQCNQIDQIILRPCLKKMGFNQSTPRSIIHAPQQYQGQGMPTLWCQQGTSQILMLIESLRTAGPLQNMATILTEWIHVFTGTTKHPFQSPRHTFPPLSHGWSASLLQFLQQTDISLQFPTKPPVLRREKDQILMDRAILYTRNVEQLKNINHCRLFLQAETLSDICTAIGDRLHPIVLDHFMAQPVSRSTKYFPIQAKPGHRPWMQFTAFLRSSFCGNSRAVELSNHLGRWLRSHTARRWNAYYHPENKQIWIPWSQDLWHVHTIVSERHSVNYQFIDPVVRYRSRVAPDVLIPVDTFHGGLQFSLPKLARRHIFETPTTLPPPPMNIQDCISLATPFSRLCLQNLHECHQPPTSILQLPGCSIAIASLVTPSMGKSQLTTSWRIHSGDDCIWSNTIHMGPTDDIQRGYAYSLYSILQLIESEHMCFGDLISSQTLRLYLPSTWIQRQIHLMLKYYGCWNRRIHMSPHFDIMQAIATKITTLQIHLHLHTNLDAADLLHTYRQALLDCKTCLSDATPLSDIDNCPIPPCMASIYIGRKLISSKERVIIQNILPIANIHSYYSTKFKWSPSTMDDIDWIAREKASTKLNRWKFITKLSCEWLPTNYRLHQVEGINPACPLCSQPETIDHMFQCSHRHEFHSQFISKLNHKLNELKTPDHLKHTICQNCLIFQQNGSHLSSPTHSQTTLGWNMFFRGFISLNMQLDTPKNWSTRLVQFLLSHATELWKIRCDDNNKCKLNNESMHQKTRMQAKAEELYALAEPLPASIRTRFLPLPISEFLRTHRACSILTWYTLTKPALQACITRFNLQNDRSRLPPNHPANTRIPPDKPVHLPMPHFLPQV